jgi:hypothetical protein
MTKQGKLRLKEKRNRDGARFRGLLLYFLNWWHIYLQYGKATQSFTDGVLLTVDEGDELNAEQYEDGQRAVGRQR